jgi:ribose 5-phosphate isomerase B
MQKKVYLGSDHAGFRLKELVKNYLATKNIEFEDQGNLVFDPNDDYPKFAEKVALAVVKNKSQGILFCGSAHGMCIVANKIPGARAAAVRSLAEAQIVRQHNNANILCLPGGKIKSRKKGLDLDFELVKKIVDLWLKTKPSAAKRHQRRLRQITKIEKKYFRKI